LKGEEVRGLRPYIEILISFAVMVSISSYQYAFTLFDKPIAQEFNALPTDVALIFTLWVLTQSTPSLFAGYLSDRYGFRITAGIGGVLASMGWIVSSLSPSIYYIYLFYGLLSGFGSCLVYVSAIGHAVKWNPQRRAFASGIVAAGFGGGTAITAIPIKYTIDRYGWRTAMLLWGSINLMISVISALMAREPPGKFKTYSKKIEVKSVLSMFKETAVVLLFLSFTAATMANLFVVGKLSRIADWLNLKPQWGVDLVSITITVSSALNIISRPFWGFVADRYGDVRTVVVAFVLLSTTTLLFLVPNTYAFIAAATSTIFVAGSAFAIFPSITSRIFGVDKASSAYSAVYMGKGVASVLAGYLSDYLAQTYGGYTVPILLSSFLNIVAAAFMNIIKTPKKKSS